MDRCLQAGMNPQQIKKESGLKGHSDTLSQLTNPSYFTFSIINLLFSQKLLIEAKHKARREASRQNIFNF
jgi:hypothetical protein